MKPERRQELMLQLARWVLEQGDFDKMPPFRSYSGRFMYGKHCPAMVCNTDFGTILIRLAQIASDNVGDLDELKEVLELLKEFRADSMGLYWPNVEWDSAFDKLMKDEDADEDE